MHDLIPVFDDKMHPEINSLLNDALRCPACGASTAMLTVLSESRAIRPRYRLSCDECRYQGPFGKSLSHAVQQWNKPQGLFSLLLQKWAGT